MSDTMSPVSPAGTSEAFIVSPPSVADRDVQTNTPVFFEDPTNGWCVGVVLGYGDRGTVMVRDAQRGVDVLAVPSSSVVPVPTAFSSVTPESFVALPTLSHLPSMPPQAWEPAILMTLLHRMHSDLWEVPVTADPPLVLSISGNQGGPQQPTLDLADVVVGYDADRCIILMPAGPGVSQGKSGRAAFDIPRRYMQIPLKEDAAVRQPRTPVFLALMTLVESLTCYSQPGRACVSGMVYSMELRHELDGHVRDMKVTPIAVDHSLASFVLPYPQEEPSSATRSPYLCFLQLAESPLVAELGLPPQQTLASLMPPCHFDEQAPSFADARASLGILKVGGPLGVQMWSVLGAILHLLLARWVLLASAAGVELPFGVLSPDEHVQWASKCLQVPTEYIVQLVKHQGTEDGMLLDFEITESALASLAGHLYDRMVHCIFSACADESRAAVGTVNGFSTHVISLLPFEVQTGVRRGYRCTKLDDKEYLVEAVQGFYERHDPERAPQAETLVDSGLGTDGMAGLLSSLEGKYNRPQWFSTRERLYDLYKACRPELTGRVDDFLMQYSGREDELFGALEAKYGFEATVRPPLLEQLTAFFYRFDPGRIDEAEPLARKWKVRPDELEKQLGEAYETQFLQQRKEAWCIYMKHNPNHVQYLDAMLSSEQYMDRGDEFVESLRARYEAEEGLEPPPSYPDLFRLMRNSVHEVFHLLFLHHHYPQSDSIDVRQALVDMLISTAAPSIVASAVDSITSVTRHVSGTFIADEIVTRFGGGYAPLVHAEGRNLTIDHSTSPCVYDMSAVWGMNSDPVTHSALNESGNGLVRAMYQLSRNGTTWVSRCVKEITGVMATLGTVESPTSWLLQLDTYSVRADVPEVNIPLILRQLKHFYVDLIAAGAGAPVSPPLKPVATPLSPEEAERRQVALNKPLPSAYHRSGGGLTEPLAGAAGKDSEGQPSVAFLSDATHLQQNEWLLRRQLENKQSYISELLFLHHKEGLNRAHCILQEYSKRCTILQALKLRTAYTMLAESILRIERKERVGRAKIMDQFFAGRAVNKVQDIEKLGRVDILREERAARGVLFQITAPVASALQRREIREAYEKHFVPYQGRLQPRQQPDINRFLELLEEEEHYRTTRHKVVLVDDGRLPRNHSGNAPPAREAPTRERALSGASRVSEKHFPSQQTSAASVTVQVRSVHQPSPEPVPAKVQKPAVPSATQESVAPSRTQSPVSDDVFHPQKQRITTRSGSVVSARPLHSNSPTQHSATPGTVTLTDPVLDLPVMARPPSSTGHTDPSLSYEEEKAMLLEKLRQFTPHSLPGGDRQPSQPSQPQHHQAQQAPATVPILGRSHSRSLSPLRSGSRSGFPLVTPPVPSRSGPSPPSETEASQAREAHEQAYVAEWRGEPAARKEQPRKKKSARAPAQRGQPEAVNDGLEDALKEAVASSAAQSQAARKAIEESISMIERASEVQHESHLQDELQRLQKEVDRLDEESEIEAVNISRAPVPAVAAVSEHEFVNPMLSGPHVTAVKVEKVDPFSAWVANSGNPRPPTSVTTPKRRPASYEDHRMTSQHPAAHRGPACDSMNVTPRHSDYSSLRSRSRSPVLRSGSRSRSRRHAGRYAPTVPLHHFLHKGQGALASDGTSPRGRSCSPSRPKGSTTVPGRLSPMSSSSVGSFRPSGANGGLPMQRDPDQIQQSFDHIRSLVVSLVDLQQQLQRPENSSPTTQKLLSEKMFRVREDLLQAQP